jgi:ribosomal protein S18 acetylase RimI-like enzyme
LTQDFYLAHGYREIGRARVLHRELARFRPIVDRQQMQIRRRTSLQICADPPATSWWEASTFGSFERTLLTLQSRDGGAPVARAMFWKMEPLATVWGIHAAGLVEVEVAGTERRQGLGTYLLGEAFRHLHGEGLALVEAQARDSNPAARALFAKLGFEQVDESVIFRKEFNAAQRSEPASAVK